MLCGAHGRRYHVGTARDLEPLVQRLGGTSELSLALMPVGDAVTQVGGRANLGL